MQNQIAIHSISVIFSHEMRTSCGLALLKVEAGLNLDNKFQNFFFLFQLCLIQLNKVMNRSLKRFSGGWPDPKAEVIKFDCETNIQLPVYRNLLKSY